MLLVQYVVHMHNSTLGLGYPWTPYAKIHGIPQNFPVKMPRDSAKFRGISCISLKKFRLPPEVKKTTSVDILIGIEYFFLPYGSVVQNHGSVSGSQSGSGSELLNPTHELHIVKKILNSM